MLDWTDYFSSKAKVKVLATICRHTYPIPLRHVASLTQLPVYSVQLALEGLHEKKILLRRKKGRSVLYSLNHQHPDASFLSTVFDYIDRELLRTRTVSYHASAQNALAFAAEARETYSVTEKKR